MANGLQTTWNVLAQTRNRAAVSVLATALRSPAFELQVGAIRASVQRKDRACHNYLIRRFATLSEAEQVVLCEAHHDMPFRMGGVLRAVLQSGDATQCENACRILVASRDYELFPALVRAAENPKHRHVEQVNAATLQLANRLHQDLADETSHGESRHRDHYFLRRQAVRALESAVQNYPRHMRLEILEAFLLIAPSDNPTRVRILRDTAYPCHQQVMKSLSSSKVPALMERLVDLLHDTAAPDSTLEIIARRTDRRFLDVLLHGQKQPVSLRVLKNMSRLRSITWLEGERESLVEHDGRAQAVAVELAQASGLPRSSVLELFALLLRRGQAEGRRASCRALTEFPGAEADSLVREALADPDSGVRSAAIAQLRQRQFPDSLPMLVALLDSPQAEIRDAARSSLAEFNFVRYRAMFNLLDDKTLRTTGRLVLKVDESSHQRLAGELTSPSSSTRRNGIAMVAAMDAVDDMCELLVKLAEDEDAGVRLDAAEALGHGSGPRVVSALMLATQDPHLSVRDVASASLEQVRARTVQAERNGRRKWRAPLMQASVEWIWLFAAWRTNWRDPFNGVYFRSNTKEVWAIFIVMGVLVASVVLWQFLTSRAYGRLPSNSPRGLFRELSRAHELDRLQRRLLKRLAAARGVHPPVLLFVQPQCFSAAGLPDEWNAHGAEIAALEQRLFGEGDE